DVPPAGPAWHGMAHDGPDGVAQSQALFQPGPGGTQPAHALSPLSPLRSGSWSVGTCPALICRMSLPRSFSSMRLYSSAETSLRDLSSRTNWMSYGYRPRGGGPEATEPSS